MAAEQLIDRKNDSTRPSPVIKATRIRISDIARLSRILELETLAERIQRALPSLSIDQIEAALAYWRDHPSEVEQEIERDETLYKEHAAR